jgi:hypothetical protein
MSIFSQPSLPDYGPGKEYFLVDSDQLRQLILDWSPDIRRDANRMEDMIRELVKTEREKAGLERPEVKATLELNQNKRSNSDCDYIGKMRVAAKVYSAKAWIAPGARFINVTFDSTL